MGDLPGVGAAYRESVSARRCEALPGRVWQRERNAELTEGDLATRRRCAKPRLTGWFSILLRRGVKETVITSLGPRFIRARQTAGRVRSDADFGDDGPHTTQI